jgi:hypothetical protein
LTKPKAASDLLNKMAAMGKGSGGLSNVAEMMTRIAMPASTVGMGADDALKFIGMIGQVSKNPGQMDEMANGVLRMFTNLRMMRRMRGVKLFDESGERRSLMNVLPEIYSKYKNLSDQARNEFLQRLSGGGDQRSLGTLLKLFNSGAIEKLESIGKSLHNSGDGIEKKLPEAINDAKSSAERLSIILKNAGEDFADPINNALSRIMQKGMNKLNLKDVGGVGIGTATLAAVVSSWYLGKTLKEIPGGLGKLFGGKAGLVSGVAEGAMMSKLGVQPVYVVNFSEMSGPGGMNGGKFEEYLPGMPGKKSQMQSAASFGIVGISAAALAVSIWAATQEKYRKVADSMRGNLNLQGGFASGASFNSDGNLTANADEQKQPDFTAPDANEYNLYSNNSKKVPVFNIPTPQANIIVYINDKKAQDVRTVTRRGHFKTSAMTDHTNTSEE